MKRILIGTTALIATTIAAMPAQAADPIKLELGGFFYEYVVAADQNSDSNAHTQAQNFDIIGSNEIFFTGQTTLDNGMTVGVDVQLEAGARSGNDDIDESYMWLSGKYGKLIIGAENDAAYKLGLSAPSVSLHGAASYDDSLGDFLLPSNTVRGHVVSWRSADANKVTYITPRYYGVQLGASYVPSNLGPGDDAGSATIERKNKFDDAWAFAANYSEKFGGVGVKAAATYSIYDDNAPTAAKDGNVSDLHFGLNVNYQGFTVGAGALLTNADTDTSHAAYEGLVWNVGAQYEEGPYAVSMTYSSSDLEGATIDNKEDKVEFYQLSSSYDLGGGISAVADLVYMNAESETGKKADGNEGALGGTLGLKLKF